MQQADVTFSQQTLTISDWHIFEFWSVMLHYISFWKETRIIHAWRGKVESQQHEVVMKGEKLTCSTVKINNSGKTSFAQGVVTCPTEMCYLLSRQTRTVSLSSCVTWMASNCWLPCEKEKRLFYITSCNWSRPPLNLSPIATAFSVRFQPFAIYSICYSLKILRLYDRRMYWEERRA